MVPVGVLEICPMMLDKLLMAYAASSLLPARVATSYMLVPPLPVAPGRVRTHARSPALAPAHADLDLMLSYGDNLAANIC